MKFAHIADLHLGRAAFNRLAEDGSNLRETLIYDNAIKSTECIINEKPDAVVIAGDWFDTVKPKTRALLTALQMLEMFRTAGIPVVAIAGNHSMQKTTSTSSAFEVLQHAHPELIAAYSFRYECAEVGDTIFHLVPNMLVPADYHMACREIEISPDHNNVLVTHGLASAIGHLHLSTVSECELDEEVLSDKFDYIALGHFHSQIQVTENAWYSGSIEHLTYGELVDKKGGLMVDPGRHTVEHIELPKTRMQDLGIFDCAGKSDETIVEEICERYGTLEGLGNKMLQVTLDWADNRPRTIPIGTQSPAGSLADILSCDLIDLKIRVRSREIERQETAATDIRAINYVEEFARFGKDRGLDETGIRKGQETIKTVIAQHVEVSE